MSAGNGSFVAMPLNSHPVSSTSLTNQHVSFAVPATNPLERSLTIPGMYGTAMGVHLYTGGFIRGENSLISLVIDHEQWRGKRVWQLFQSST